MFKRPPSISGSQRSVGAEIGLGGDEGAGCNSDPKRPSIEIASREGKGAGGGAEQDNAALPHGVRSSRVVMRTSMLLTAKWTSAPHGKPRSGSEFWPLGFGLRSKRYWSIASRTLWVKSVLSSTVATGRPLRKRTRSSAFSLAFE